MIKITIELVSAIHPSRSKVLGVAKITNDGTGSNTKGNYKYEFSKSGKSIKQIWKSGEIKNFNRKRFLGWDLLYLCLKDCLSKRHKNEI